MAPQELNVSTVVLRTFINSPRNYLRSLRAFSGGSDRSWQMEIGGKRSVITQGADGKNPRVASVSQIGRLGRSKLRIHFHRKRPAACAH